jgi:hypothetical protein
MIFSPFGSRSWRARNVALRPLYTEYGDAPPGRLGPETRRAPPETEGRYVL